ncbi:unnamed protein product [Rotaria sordida]|uniref:Uncharacterized protein n=1 Tax=Rotaria sordida TaxID=392033 RepID=A0A819QK30_9BILA|nr:unnamed protein product [Rotaria sordida]CAF4026702.1 unnamed protein product [Rotaria sordida]
MSLYRSPSPFSSKLDYKSMYIEQFLKIILCLIVYQLHKGEYARRFLELIDYGDENICQRLFINLNHERRRDRIKFDNTIFKATLYHLSSIIEKLYIK